MFVETTAPFRRVAGTLIRGVADGLLGGAQGIPLAGAQVTATASVKSAASGEFIVLDPVDGTTDQNARLRNASTGEDGILLLVTDDPSIGVIGWTWHITVTAPSLNRPGQPPRVIEFDIDVPSGEGDLDLATLVPVPGNVGEDVILWREAVEQTAQNLAESQAIVATSVNDAAIEGDLLVLTTREGGRIEAGNVRGPGGQSAYEIWLAQGNTGTVEEWQEATRGQDGSNVLPTDDAVAQAVQNDASLTNVALDRRGPVRIAVGETNRTSELQEWVADLHAGRDRGSLRPGVYVAEGLVLPSLTTLSGAGGGMARFGANDDRAEGEKIDRLWGAVTIRRPSGSTSSAPMVHLKGPGASLRGVTLDANGSAATSLLSESFEGSILDVRMIGGAGIAWDVLKANNGLMRNILVDNHGSATLPAVRIRSVPGAGNAAHTNAQLIDLLTIERSVNTALQVGELGTATEAVEWLMLRNLHVEAPDDNSASPGNAGPLIRLLNVKGVSFFDPLIYGGPGYLIEQDQDRTVALDPGGVRIVGGILIGQEEDNASPFLVHLIRGDNFAALGAKFTRYNNHAFEVESTFGRRVWVDTARVDIEDQAILDRRAARSVYRTFGNAEIRGHVVSRGRVPTVVVGGGVAGLVSSDCDDSSGRIYFGTTGSPVAGGQFEVKFAEPFSGRAPVVTLTPATAAAAALRWHVTSTTTGFVARTDVPPPANLAAGAVGVSYSVVG